MKNNNEKKTKKPFYKKVWFWIVAIIVAVIAVSASSSNDEGSKKTDSDKTSKSSSTPKKIEKTTYKVGDTAEYKGVEYKVNSVKYDDGDEFSTPKDGNKYVVINVTITNKSDNKVDYNPYDFKLDDNGNQTDLDEISSNVDNTLNSGSLTSGATVTGNLVGQGNPTNKLKVIYMGGLFGDKEKVTFNLN